MHFENSLSFAQSLDRQDPLNGFRQKFHIPPVNGQPSVYFTGNSLGLQPIATLAAIQQELDDWKNLGVEGHFKGKNPWFSYHHFLTENAAKIV
ncbi:MAG: kynureninase, partial [Bacteroidota bacterium]